jgi:predicted amidohydrolase
MKIRIAQIKMIPQKGNLKANHAVLMELLASLRHEAIDVVITPECFLDGYVCTEADVTADNIGEYATDPRSSEFLREISTWAKHTATWVILGCMRYDETGIYNTSLAIDRHGTLVGHYDKVHCQTHDKKYTPGNSLPVFDADFGKFGMMICADRRWPETVRTLALKGARIIFNPTYGMHDERNLHMMQTRSYESEVFIAFTHPQQSLVTDPKGNIVINDEDETNQVCLSDIDLAIVDQVRAGESAHLKDRRADVYDELSNPS